MFVLKIDFPTGVAYFTGKKKVVQGLESPGLTDNIAEAKIFEDETEAARFCKMLIKKFDMEFYYSVVENSEVSDDAAEEELMAELTENLGQQVMEEAMQDK